MVWVLVLAGECSDFIGQPSQDSDHVHLARAASKRRLVPVVCLIGNRADSRYYFGDVFRLFVQTGSIILVDYLNAENNFWTVLLLTRFFEPVHS